MREEEEEEEEERQEWITEYLYNFKHNTCILLIYLPFNIKLTLV